MQSPPPKPAKTTLTRSQQKILDAILFFQRKGEFPTVREIGALVGHRSPATVFKHLRTLERAKLISMNGNGKSRGIRLADPSLLKSSSSKGVSSPLTLQPISLRAVERPRSVPLVGVIAAGRPFESYADGFLDGFDESFSPDLETESDSQESNSVQAGHAIPIDPRLFAQSGELLALRIEGDSMVNAGILDGDYVIIRRQNTVEDGDIAAVIINGEGTLKRWHVRSRRANGEDAEKIIQLAPANERFDPIEITEDEAKDILVFGKYVGLVRGNLQLF